MNDFGELEKSMVQNKRAGFVANFDILGFKNAVKYSSDRAWIALNLLYDKVLEICSTPVNIPSMNKSVIGLVNAFHFSDTVVIFSEKDRYEDFFSLVIDSAVIFAHALTFGIPIRGGIAKGDFFVGLDKRLHSGKAFIQAYEAGETAKWLGIVIDRDMFSLIKERGWEGNDRYFVEWDVPTGICFFGKTRKMVINWPYICKDIEANTPKPEKEQYKIDFSSLLDAKSSRELYDKNFSELFGPYDRLSIYAKQKYKNTFNFLKAHLK